MNKAFDINDSNKPTDEKCEGKVSNAEIAIGGKFYIRSLTNSDLYIGVDDQDENKLKM